MRGASSRILQFGAIVFSLLCIPLLAIRSKGFDQDPDIWWHIRVGDWIVQHHALPRFAIFSEYGNRPWTAYSWCFDLLVSGIQSVFGLPGIPGLLICLEILVSLTFLLAIRRVAERFWWAWWIATAGIYASYVNPLRPSIFTVLFFILEMLLIFEAERTRDDSLLYWMGPLFAIWANFHIQFVYGMAVFALYIGARMLTLRTTQASARGVRPTPTVLRLIGNFAVAVLGSFVGPNGWLPYKVAVGLADQTFVYQIVTEMMAMNFRRPEHYVVLFLLMAACFAVGRRHSRDLFRPMLLVMTAIVSFRSTRDVWFAAVAASFVIAEAVRERAPATVVEARPAFWNWEPVGYALAPALALALSIGYGVRHGVTTLDMIREIDGVYPIRATEFVSDRHLQGPLYNSFNWGGFLIFNLRDQAVSMDPRTNVYGDELLKRSIATTNGIKWQSDPDLARANLVILERYLPLASALSKNPDYRLVYQDQVAMVFVKQTPS
jgi:hypothetical protein